jgi:hypothetical protein
MRLGLVTPLAPLDPLTGLISALHIRAGANEADAIVPEQEKLGRYLGQMDEFLKQPLHLTQLQEAYGSLAGYWQQFKAWLYSEQFTKDGDTRASDQSVDTMEWQVNDRLARIQSMLLAMGGTLPPMTSTQGPYTSIPGLTVPVPGQSYLPGAGTLPPVNTYAPPGTTFYAPQGSPDIPQGLVYAGLAAVAGYLLFGR